MNVLLIVFLTAAALSLIGTGIVRSLQVRRGVLDMPNARSSHTAPIPRGGGLSFAAVVIITALIMAAWRDSSSLILLSFALASTLVVLIGYLDDRYSLSAEVRLGVHIVAVAAILAAPGLDLTTSLRVVLPAPDWLLLIFPAIALVWLTNLFNFMDGIDGIAASEALFVALSLLALDQYGLRGSSGAQEVLAAIAGGSAGFLFWNWSPAKIFMGDVGSAFLGFALGWASLALISRGLPAAVPAILLAAFVTDATMTLLRRIWRGERWAQPHKSHVYQLLARRMGSHARATTLYIVLNVCWLLPLAACATRAPRHAALWIILAYAPLIAAMALMGSISHQESETPGKSAG